MSTTHYTQPIREWLATQTQQDGSYRPCLLMEIAIAMGQSEDPTAAAKQRMHMGWAISQMVEAGFLGRVPITKRMYRYFFIRHPAGPLSAEELLERKRTRQRERQRKLKGRTGRTWEQYVKQRRAQAVENAKAREANRDAFLAKERARNAIRRKKVRTERREQLPKFVPVPVVVPRAEVVIVPEAPKARIETIDEWMARAGNEPQRLPPGAVSKPLRHIGHDAHKEAA